jgi:hypothetical protein
LLAVDRQPCKQIDRNATDRHAGRLDRYTGRQMTATQANIVRHLQIDLRTNKQVDIQTCRKIEDRHASRSLDMQADR